MSKGCWKFDEEEKGETFFRVPSLSLSLLSAFLSSLFFFFLLLLLARFLRAKQNRNRV